MSRRFNSQMLAKFAEDDRIEQMNAQRRRMKQQEHKRAVEQLIEERRRQHDMDKVGFCNPPFFVNIAISLNSYFLLETDVLYIHHLQLGSFIHVSQCNDICNENILLF